jgi:hypothetical protein
MAMHRTVDFDGVGVLHREAGDPAAQTLGDLNIASLPSTHVSYGGQRPERECCPVCGRSLEYLMSVDPSKPGFGGLLRGEGEDRPLIAVAWLALLLIVFGSAGAAFAAMSAGLGSLG